MIIKVKFEEQNTLLKTKFDTSVNVVLPTVENYYTGDYEITPSINPQVLETAQKTMKRNVEVTAIPYSVTTNKTGGKTATIA